MNFKQFYLQESKNKPFIVNISQLYSATWKIKETIQEINNNQPSKTIGPITISKIGLNKYYVINGNHRVVESLLNSNNTVDAILDEYTPDMNKTGGAYNNEINNAVQISSVIKNNNTLNETVEPIKPSNKVTQSRIIKNKGTIQQKELIQYKFTTKNNNEVKVQLSDQGDNTADVVFYVNDTLDDGSSTSRDPEILNGVLWIMKEIPKRYNFNTITFSAWSGKGDNKIIKNLPITEPKQQFLKAYDTFFKSITNFKPTEIPPSQTRIDLAKKFNKPLIPLFDVNKDYIMPLLNDIKEYIKTDDPLIRGIISKLDDLYQYKDSTIINKLPGYEDLIKYGKKYSDAILSNTDYGLPQTHNRRQSLYSKILNKFFSNDWNITQRNSSFSLTKK